LPSAPRWNVALLVLLGDVLALEDPGVADLGDEDSAVLDLDPLGDQEPDLVPFAALELRVSRPLLEEVREGPVQVLEDLLQRLRIGIFQPGRFRLLLERGSVEILEGLAHVAIGAGGGGELLHWMVLYLARQLQAPHDRVLAVPRHPAEGGGVHQADRVRTWGGGILPPCA